MKRRRLTRTGATLVGRVLSILLFSSITHPALTQTYTDPANRIFFQYLTGDGTDYAKGQSINLAYGFLATNEFCSSLDGGWWKLSRRKGGSTVGPDLPICACGDSSCSGGRQLSYTFDQTLTSGSDYTFYFHYEKQPDHTPNHEVFRVTTPFFVVGTTPRVTSPTNGSTVDSPTPTFEWEDIPESTQYRVLVGHPGFSATCSGAAPNAVDDAIVTANSYSVPSGKLDWGTDYMLQLCSFQFGFDFRTFRTFSTPTRDAPPSAPTGLSTSARDSEVVLSWNAGAELDLAHYSVYRGTSSGFGAPIATVPVGTESYVDTGLTNGTTYFYRLKSVDAANNSSEFSAEVSATPFEPVQASIDVTLPTVSGRTGDSAVIAVQVGDLAGAEVTAFDFSIGYDPVILSIPTVSITGTLAAACTVLSNSPQAGLLAVSAGCTSGLTGAGTLTNLDVTYLSEGTSSLTWQSFVFNEGQPAANAIDGSASVTSCPVCGDVSGNGSVSGFDASLILQHNVGLNPTPFWGCAADVTSNGSISGLDAANVLQFNVGLISELTCSASKSAFEPESGIRQSSELRWNRHEKPDPGTESLSFSLGSAKQPVVSVEIRAQLKEGSGNVESVTKTGLPEDWLLEYHAQGTELKIAAAGATPASEGELLRIELAGATQGLAEISAALNEDHPHLVETAEEEVQPVGFSLAQNYPNPFNPTTEIEFELAMPSLVALQVTDVLGRIVARLATGFHEEGRHRVVFDGSRLPSGIYVYTLINPNSSAVRQMVLLK